MNKIDFKRHCFMKKYYSLLLPFLVAFSSLFVSCDENGKDLEPAICKVTVISDGDGDGVASITNYVGAFANVLIGNNVEVVATPADGSAFLCWYVSGSDTPVSTDARFVFTASENITLIARFAKLSNLILCSAGNGSVSFKDSADTSVAVLPGTEITVVATPDENYDFIGWFVGDEATPVSTDADYTFEVVEDMLLTAQFCFSLGVAVDLGLSVKWAAYNVGATKPGERGSCYAWGETEEKSDYSWSTYKWCNGSYSTLTKYCKNVNYGIVDNKTVLDPEDDVAHVKWGGSWRMPTKAELTELCTDCTWIWTTFNDVKGYMVIGPSGNSIFLPATIRVFAADGHLRCFYGDCWSSSLSNEDSYAAYDLGFSDDLYEWREGSRENYKPVRPVCE